MEQPIVGLYELNTAIADCIDAQFARSVWVSAEIVGLTENRTGHCYLELMEKDEAGTIRAKAKATIWASLYRQIKPYFLQETGMPLAVGMTVALCVEVTFHPNYGLSFNVKDINPAFTLGNRMMQRNKVIRQLQDEGVFTMNHDLPLPLLPRRIAVVSAQTAAGYGDFMNELTRNEWGFSFQVTLFPALVQGEAAAASMLAALQSIAMRADEFDVVVLIRGGGSVADLACFDDYDLSYMITQMPLPVIAGIGHDRDVSVADMVVALSLKTPTAVAQFLVQKSVQQYQLLLSLQERFYQGVKQLLQRQQTRIDRIAALLPLCALRCIEQKQHRLEMLSRSLQLLSPYNVLKKGYTMTLKNGVVVSAENVQKGDVITTVFYNGQLNSIITDEI